MGVLCFVENVYFFSQHAVMVAWCDLGRLRSEFFGGSMWRHLGLSLEGAIMLLDLTLGG
jgi:hypothetical protein